MSDIDAIFREITEIDEKLEQLPADAYAERLQLEERHQELRAEAAKLASASDAERPVAEIQVELRALRQQLDAIDGGRIDVVSQSGGGDAAGPGAEALGTSDLNRRLEEAQGAGQIEARIAELEAQLKARGVEPGG